MTLPITFPKRLVSDFLGTFAVDVMHDAKGRGILKDQKLVTLTDLFALAVVKHNPTLKDPQTVKTWFFCETLKYLTRLWSDNLGALGLKSSPDFSRPVTDTEYWKDYQQKVLVPIRAVADRDDEDTFVSLGRNKKSAETQNYHDQKDLLGKGLLLEFISPEIAEEYYQRAQAVGNKLHESLGDTCHVVLDMKSSAGLLRTVIDPLGYITGLPTYTDPGYNMPGMSAIRQYSHVPFTEDKSSQFIYRVQLASPFGIVTFFHVQYFYAGGKLTRKNAMIRILDELFIGTLPRASEMTNKLANYLKPAPQKLMLSVRDILSTLQNALLNRGQTSQADEFTRLHCGDFSDISEYREWCGVNLARCTFAVATIRNMRTFAYDGPVIPERLITNFLPNLLRGYITSKKPDIKALAFCYYQLEIIRQYLRYPGVNEPELAETLDRQRLPGRHGKLVTQIGKLVAEWRKKQAAKLDPYANFVRQYLQMVIQHCREQLEAFSSDDEIDDQVIDTLPIFNPPKDLARVLLEHLQFYHSGRQDFLLGLLDTILWKKPLWNPGLSLQEEISLSISTEHPKYDYDDLETDTLRYVLGKFSGDFGQIAWCVDRGYIFASEDNNTSAMALLLHRLSIPGKWASIHGWGDGSRVDVTITSTNTTHQ